jgi:hypothetical protein
VYNNADGATSVGELATRLNASLGTPNDEAVARLALAELSRIHLVTRAGADDAVTRRLVVRRLGVALALPLVTSLLVPAAAAAQSKFGDANGDKGNNGNNGNGGSNGNNGNNGNNGHGNGNGNGHGHGKGK